MIYEKLTKISTALLIAGLGFSFAASAKVTVFAAASMTDALQQVAKDYAKQNPKNEVVFFRFFFNFSKTS